MSEVVGHPTLVDERFLGGNENTSTLYTLELRRGRSDWLVTVRSERQRLLLGDVTNWSSGKRFKTAAEARRFFSGDGWRRLVNLTHDRSGFR